MNLQTPPAHPPDQLLPPGLSPHGFWRQVFPELVLIWASGLLIGIRIAASLALPEALAAISLGGLVALSAGWAKGQLALRFDQLRIPAWQQFTTDLLLGLAKLTATAALLLELARYGLQQFPQIDSGWLLPVALLALLALAIATALRNGTPSPSRFWIWLLPVGLLLLGLGWIELLRLGGLRSAEWVGLNQPSSLNWPGLLQAAALLAVAYPSYEPLSLPTSPPAASVRLTLKILCFSLSLGWLLFWGAALLANSSAVPLWMAASDTGMVRWIGLGAIATLTGALLTLLPQLMRQFLRLNQQLNRQDANPQSFNHQANYRSDRQLPSLDLLGLTLVLASMLLVGDLESLWSFSAFAGLMQAVLAHWALLTAVPLSGANRPLLRRRTGRRSDSRLFGSRVFGFRLPLRWPTLRECFQGLRLAACLLAFWVDWQVWLVSLSLISLGLVWRGMLQWSDDSIDR